MKNQLFEKRDDTWGSDLIEFPHAYTGDVVRSRDLLPPLSLSARSGGFSFKAGVPASISELSPRAPRFFIFVCNLCAASFHLFQHTPSFFPDIDCRIFVSIMIRQTPVAEPLVSGSCVIHHPFTKGQTL